MIITRDVDVKVDSTFTGESIKMGVDQEAMQHIMAILSEQYSDPMEAVVREYSTNAIDSQVAAGWTRPVELTSPTMLNSMFKVQDFGLGMDADDIRNVYSNYGSSTKRDSNDFNGTMGIGSKSAFAYTNQFTVVGIKNGVRTTVVVSRDEEGGGDMQIVDTSRTDEDNGVTISVPVSDWMGFGVRVRKVAKAMPTGMLLVDGKDISEWPTYKKIVGTIKDSAGNVVVNGIYHTNESNYYSPHDTIYMGGVSYPALKSLADVRTSPAYSIMADVPMGAVQFAPSREALKDIRSTREMHDKIAKIYIDNLASSVEKDIREATNVFSAVTIFNRNQSVLNAAGLGDIAWNGVRLAPRSVTTGDAMSNAVAKKWQVFDFQGARTRQSAYTINRVAIGVKNTVFIKGYKNLDTISSSHKAKAVYWFQEHYSRPDYWNDDSKEMTMMFFNVVPDSFKSDDVLKHIEWVDWEDIAAIKMPRKPRTNAPRQSRGGKHNVWVTGKHVDELIDMDDIDVDNVYFFVRTQVRRVMIDSYFNTGGTTDENLNRLVGEYANMKGDRTAVVSVYANSVDKFRRDFPKSKQIQSHVTMVNEIADTKLAKITPELKKNAGWKAVFESSVMDVVKGVIAVLGDGALLDKDTVALAKVDGQHINTWTMFPHAINHRIKADAIVNEAAGEARKKIAAVEACYPMLDVVGLNRYDRNRDRWQAVADYMNNIYREKEKA